MKTVISASRRTDIPAFYLDWFIRALRTGRVQVNNPLYKEESIQVSLRPEDTEWIVFWSRNYRRFLKQRENFTDYNLFFHFTILSHHQQLERSHLPVDQALKQVEKLAAYYGPQRIIWRYDPLVIWQEPAGVSSNYNPAEFDYLCRQLSRLSVQSCYISLVSPYRKFLCRFNRAFPGRQLLSRGNNAVKDILVGLKETATGHNIRLFSCCNDDLTDSVIKKGKCISGELLNDLSGEITVSRAKAPTRKDCGCTRSVDIGDYKMQPCFLGCLYCYANPVILKGQRDKENMNE